MNQVTMFDEYRVVLTAPAGLPKASGDAIRRVLDSRAFKAELRKAVRAVFAGRPELAKLKVTVHC
jgi:hypothetical protein